MKKLLLLSAVLLGAVGVTRAGVNVHIGIPLPPNVVISAPAPRVYLPPPPVYLPPPPVVVVPPPRVVVPAPVYHGPVIDVGFGWYDHPRRYYPPSCPPYRHWHGRGGHCR